MSQYEEIADAMIAKKPALAALRDQMVAEIEFLHSMTGMLVDNLEALKPQIKAAVSMQPAPDQTLCDEIDKSFAEWGISFDKFAEVFGVEGTEDVYKVVAITLEQQADATVENESMKSFIIAKLHPEFDILTD